VGGTLYASTEFKIYAKVRFSIYYAKEKKEKRRGEGCLERM